MTEVGPLAETICPRLSLAALVEAGACVDTALGAHVDAIEVECGLQGTEQASANAVELVSEFLIATGALAGTVDVPERALPVYRLDHPIAKPPAQTYAVHVPNFERVEPGETYATSDDMALVAEEAFYPVFCCRPPATSRSSAMLPLWSISCRPRLAASLSVRWR